jgi:penicillin-binding protein 2
VAAAGDGERLLRHAAEKNRIRNVPILAPRGKILDREGRIIVDNYPSFSACCCAILRAISMPTRI